MTATDVFAEWALGSDRIPFEAAHAARRHLLDGIGCGLAARGLAVPAPALGLVAGRGATLIGGGPGDARTVALANGNLIHALDFDDVHADSHVNVTAAIAPATLAAAELAGATWDEAVEAYVVGAEVITRLGSAAGEGLRGRGFHTSSVAGIFGAVLAVARLRRLDPGTAADALGVAGSLAAGSLEFLADGAPTNPLHPGLSAANALLAVDLAVAGAAGPGEILEGAHGIFAVYAGASVDVDGLTADLGSRWEVERMTIKPYPVSRMCHATLEALASLGPIPAESVASVVVEIPEDAVDAVAEPADAKVDPRSEHEAKASVQWAVAVHTIDGSIGAATFRDGGFRRPDAVELARRVDVRGMPTSGTPGSAPGRVAVTLADGRELVGEVGVPQGGPARPLTEEQLLAKFAENARAWGADPDAAATAILTGSASTTDTLATTRYAA